MSLPFDRYNQSFLTEMDATSTLATTSTTVLPTNATLTMELTEIVPIVNLFIKFISNEVLNNRPYNKTFDLNTTDSAQNVTLPCYRAPGMHPITVILCLVILFICAVMYLISIVLNYAKYHRLRNQRRQHELLPRIV